MYIQRRGLQTQQNGTRLWKQSLPLTLLLAIASPCLAEEAPESNPIPQKEASTNRKALTLPEVLRQVEKNYPKLIGAERERQQARQRRKATEGAFDTNIRFGTNFEQYNSSGKDKDFTTNSVTAEVLTRSGITLFGGVILNEGAVKSPLSNTGSLGTYNVGVRIPLLRGWRVNQREATERQARIGEPLADAAFADIRLDTLYNAGFQYWNWVAASRRIKITQSLYQVAVERERQIAEEVKSGIRQGIDAFEAEVEVRRRQEALSKAEQEFQKEQFKLGLYLWNTEGKREMYPDAEQIPASTIDPVPYPIAQREKDRALAIERRPEIRSIRLARALLQVDQDVARNDLLPNVDVVVNPGLDTGSNAIGAQMKVGIQFAVPLERRTAQGKLGEVRLKLEKLQQEEQLQRQQIEIEVETAFANVNQTYLRYRAAVQEVEAARALEKGERDRLALGEGTLFLVNQRERATAEAQIKVISIQAEHEQAVIAYRAATAQL